jgi:RimJ/RimL family protein N-acetyltransferase
MRVRGLDGATEFLDATLALRAADPVGTNIHGSIAQSVADGSRHYEREFWLVVEDDGGTVVGAALWTLPHKLLVTPMPVEAARAVGDAAARLDVPVHGVIGPADVARAAAAAARPGAVVSTYMGERLLVLGDYHAPDPLPGALRLVGEDDVERAVRWLDAFTTEARVLVVDNRAAVENSLGRLWFWEVDGEPVSMAGHAPVVATPSAVVARIGPVFTPARHRGRRFGSAVTAGVVEHLLPRVGTVMLYTDAANPTSNAVYERLGFRHVTDIVDLDVVPL